MAWRQGNKRTGDADGFELRVRPQDRVGGPPKSRAMADAMASGAGVTPPRRVKQKAAARR